jgi:AcrR family transcriptional regulator
VTGPEVDDGPARSLGRPRDAQAGPAILRAAVGVLADHGPSGFTVDEVAARAGCGKATIYRRWPSRARLLLDTAQHMGLEMDDPDTGSMRDDLLALIGNLAGKLRDTPSGRVMAGIIAEAAVNPEMRAALTAFVDARRSLAVRAVERGVARGELPAGTDPHLVADLLGGPVFFRMLIHGTGVDDEVVKSLVDTVLAGARAVTRPGGGAGPR